MGANSAGAAGRRVARSPYPWIAGALTIARLWLGTGLAIFPLANSGRDDRMFLGFAGEILRGAWLGPYDCLTFAKAPLFPAWIAATVATGVPLLPAQQFLYVVACAAFVLAIAPAIPAKGARLILYGALIFQPASFTSATVSRVAREGIYPALTLLLLAAAAGTMLRLRRPGSAVLGGALAGLALAALWLTREEGVWVLPTLALLAVAPWTWAGPRPSRVAWVSALVAGCAAFAVGWGAVAAVNDRYYGVLATRVDSLQDAYGALTRVEHLRWRLYVPVPRETRDRIYRASPTFRLLAPHLEGRVGLFWAGSSCPGVGVCDDVGGGWFTWALRDSAQAAGWYSSAPEAERFWAAVASEVNRACSEGRLRCGPSRSSLAEPWRWEYVGPLLSASGRAVVLLAWPRGLVASVGGAPQPGAEGGPYVLLAGQRFATWPDPDVRVTLLDWIAAPWPAVQLAILVAALVAFLRQGIGFARRREGPSPAWILSAILLVAVASRVGLVSYVDVTSFPGVDPLYLAPAYPLVLAFALLVATSPGERLPWPGRSSRTRQ